MDARSRCPARAPVRASREGFLRSLSSRAPDHEVRLNVPRALPGQGGRRGEECLVSGDVAPGQEQTLHFRYLLAEHGGTVVYGSMLEEHTAQLARGLGGDYDREAIRRFAESFLRPRGLDKPVGPILADDVAALAGVTNRPGRKGIRSRLRRPSQLPFAARS